MYNKIGNYEERTKDNTILYIKWTYLNSKYCKYGKRA